MLRRVLALGAVLAACAPTPRTEAPTAAVAPTAAPAAPSLGRAPICSATTELLASFTSPVRVEAYVTTGHPKLQAFVRELRDLLARSATASGETFSYSVTEVANEEALEAARNAGLQEEVFQLGPTNDQGVSVKEADAVRGIMGLVFRYGTETDKITVLPPDAAPDLEFWLAIKLRELRDRADGKHHALGVLRGHGEPDLGEGLLPASSSGPSLAALVRQYFPEHHLVDVDLAGGTKDVDPALDGLLMLQPGRDISEKELRAVDRFVMKGKSLAVVASAVNVQKGYATMLADLSTHGLERLTLGYGIELRSDVLIDFRSSFHLDVAGTQAANTLRLPYLVDVRAPALDTRFPVFFRSTGALFPFASSVVVHPDKQTSAAVRVVARTSPGTEREVRSPVDLSLARHWKVRDPLSAEALAASSSGTLRSAFDPAVRSARSARVLVIASSQFLANPLVRAGSPDNTKTSAQSTQALTPSTDAQFVDDLARAYMQRNGTSLILTMKNLLDWMAYDDSLARCSLLAGASRLSRVRVRGPGSGVGDRGLGSGVGDRIGIGVRGPGSGVWVWGLGSGVEIGDRIGSGVRPHSYFTCLSSRCFSWTRRRACISTARTTRGSRVIARRE